MGRGQGVRPHGGGRQQDLYRLVDDAGQVVDVLLRDHRATASAAAYFRQAQERAGCVPDEIVSDHHQPSITALLHTWPGVHYVRSGLHREREVTTKPVERRHLPPLERRRNTRGLQTTTTVQRFLEGFEALYARRHGQVLAVGRSTLALLHERVRQVARTFKRLGRQLGRTG